MPFSDFGVLLGDVSLWEIERATKKPVEAQKNTLKKIISRNKNCVYGKKYGFADIKSIEDFQAKVPITTYEDYEPYVERVLDKEKNVMFTGPNIRYCSDSAQEHQGLVEYAVHRFFLLGCNGIP